MPPTKKLRLQKRIDCSTADYCCVPKCQACSKYSAGLSFHSFPSDAELLRKWILATRRDQFTPNPRTRICSRHFRPEDIASEKGRRLLKKGIVPQLFEWNNFSTAPPGVGTQRPGGWETERTQRPRIQVEAPSEAKAKPNPAPLNRSYNGAKPNPDHDYASTPAVVDLTLEENRSLREEILQLKKQIEKHSLERFGLHRFVGSDEEINFFTGFSSYDRLMAFWKLIEPATSKIVRVTAAETNKEVTTPSRSTRQSLEPVDELFLFLVYLSVGLEDIDLGHRFNIEPSTVSRIIVTWVNFLYTLLGSISIWMSQEQVQANLPVEFKNYPDTQVIIDCVELKCQTPSSVLLQSKMCSTYKPHCTMRGLLGMAPHGTVTFVSSLYAGSVSDKEIFKHSGMRALLTESMAVMANKGFLVDECAPGPVHRPFLSKQSQMSAGQVLQTQEIARLRVHVDRLIGRVKENKLFDTIIPLAMAGSTNQLFSVACLLLNYQCKPLEKVFGFDNTPMLKLKNSP